MELHPEMYTSSRCHCLKNCFFWGPQMYDLELLPMTIEGIPSIHIASNYIVSLFCGAADSKRLVSSVFFFLKRGVLKLGGHPPTGAWRVFRGVLFQWIKNFHPWCVRSVQYSLDILVSKRKTVPLIRFFYVWKCCLKIFRTTGLKSAFLSSAGDCSDRSVYLTFVLNVHLSASLIFSSFASLLFYVFNTI